jgi:hypothetical protein
MKLSGEVLNKNLYEVSHYLCHGHVANLPSEFFRHTGIWKRNRWGQMLGEFSEKYFNKIKFVDSQMVPISAAELTITLNLCYWIPIPKCGPKCHPQMFRLQIPLCPVVVGHDYGVDGRMGNAKSIKQVVCLSHILYWSRSRPFCFLAHVPGWDELSFINLDTGKAYIGHPK